MSQRSELVLFDALTADPSSPADGEIWLRSDLQRLKWRDDTISRDLSRRDNLAATQSPTVNDDLGDDYDVGSIWIDVTHRVVWMAVSVGSGTASWIPISHYVAQDIDAAGAFLTTTYASVGSVGSIPIGTYWVWGMAYATSDNSNDGVQIGLQLNGGTTVIAISERTMTRGGAPANIESTLNTVAEIQTTGASDTIDLMARETAANGTLENLVLIAELAGM